LVGINGDTEFAGEIGYIDLFQYPIQLYEDSNTSQYLFGIIDTCTQIVWIEVLDETEALTMMFATLKCFSIFSEYYNVKFKEVRFNENLKELLVAVNGVSTPFQRLLSEQSVDYKEESPKINLNDQANEFWECIYTDLLKDRIFENKCSLKEKIVAYLYYYNEKRIHKKLRGMTPNGFNKRCSRHI